MFIQKKKDVWLSIKVIPNADKNKIVDWFNEDLKIKISAVPEKGKANKELIYFLAKILNIAKSEIKIVQGITNHRKILIIKNILKENIAEKINSNKE